MSEQLLQGPTNVAKSKSSSRCADVFKIALDFIQRAYPTKSKETVDKANKSEFDGGLTWSTDEAKKPPKDMHVRRESATLLPTLHAASRGNLPFAKKIMEHLARRAGVNARKHQTSQPALQSFEEELFARIKAMTADLHSQGTRPKDDQQALDALLTFVCYPVDGSADDSPPVPYSYGYCEKLAKRLSLSRASVQKAVERAESVRAEKKKRDDEMKAAAMTIDGSTIEGVDTNDSKKGRRGTKRKDIRPIYKHPTRKMRKDCKKHSAQK